MNTELAQVMAVTALMAGILFLATAITLEIAKWKVQDKLDKEGKPGTYKVTMPHGWTFKDFTFWEAYEKLLSNGATFYGKQDIFSRVFYVRICPKYRYPIFIFHGYIPVHANNEFCLRGENRLPKRIRI